MDKLTDQEIFDGLMKILRDMDKRLQALEHALKFIMPVANAIEEVYDKGREDEVEYRSYD